MAGGQAARSAALAAAVRRASEYGDVTTADEVVDSRVLPVSPALGALLPGRGLRRGSVIAVQGATPAGTALPVGSSALVMALLGAASQAGSWCAVVGIPTFGTTAATEMGIALERLALVPHPGPDWPTTVAALIDGVDVVVAATPPGVAPSVTRGLTARARQRGCVLIPFGTWDGADVTLRITGGHWQGLERGRGRLRCRELAISARGRGAAARPKEATIWLPSLSGTAAPVERPRLALVP